jgi:hypothetical protein
LRLQPGTTFPTLTGPTVGGGTLSVPGDLQHGHSVLVIYRGHF